jgi:hypothetical protein
MTLRHREAREQAMKTPVSNWIAVGLYGVLLAMPTGAGAKGAVTRIEVAQGRSLLVTLVGEESAGQFTIWSGPGTQVTAADGTVSTPAHPGDIADWAAGAMAAPRKGAMYEVRFYCAEGDVHAAARVPVHQCYGVRYSIERKTGLGYIQVPKADDAQFRGNTQSIYRGVEGSWFRASGRWEELVRPQVEAALAERARIDDDWQDYTPPARTAVGATSTVTPKQK